MREAVDTSVIVAGLLAWHEHHAPARAALDSCLRAGSLTLPAPALLEAYSVMTRLPAPYRIGSTDAHALLESTFGSSHGTALELREVWALLDWLESKHIAGGLAYDGQILACARKAGARRLLTFNERDFLALDPGDIEIRRPA